MRVLVDGLLADTELDPQDARVSRADGGGERAAEPSDRELPHLLASRSRPLSRSTFAPAHRSRDCDVRRRRGPRSAATSGSTSRSTSSPRLPPVMADAEAVSTALVNLLDNALEVHTGRPRIGLRRRIATATASCSCRLGQRHRYPRPRAAADLPALLSRRPAPRRDTGGVGLGLSIVESIVRGHGGTVTVRSVPGAGQHVHPARPGSRAARRPA